MLTVKYIVSVKSVKTSFQCLYVRCVKLESGRLAEEVKDCGPVVDLEATPGCFLVKDGADPKADFPACCPVYECEEGTEVTN